MLYYGFVGKSGGIEQVPLTQEMIEIHEESPHGHILLYIPGHHLVEIPLAKYRHAQAAVRRDEAEGYRTMLYP